MASIHLNIDQCLTLEEIHYLLHSTGNSSDFSRSRNFNVKIVKIQLPLPLPQIEVSPDSVKQEVISIHSDITCEDDDNSIEDGEILEEPSDNLLSIEQLNIASPDDNNVCCICQEKPKVICYPYDCNSSHTMCYPECVSHYAYVSRLRSANVKCPCCRRPFDYLKVVDSSNNEPNVRKIPFYPDIIRSKFTEEQKKEGCAECWGIYHPDPLQAYSDYFHSKKKGHRGRHLAKPLYYQE